MEKDNHALPAIASGFAGGIGNTGAVCGAVVGGVMTIGLKLGRAYTLKGMLDNLAVSREFRSRFEAEMKSIQCHELTGIDLSTEEGIEQLMSSDTPRRVCFPAVGSAYRIAVELIKEISP